MRRLRHKRQNMGCSDSKKAVDKWCIQCYIMACIYLMHQL